MFSIIIVEKAAAVPTFADTTADRRTEIEWYANDVEETVDEAENYRLVFEAAYTCKGADAITCLTNISVLKFNHV